MEVRHAAAAAILSLYPELSFSNAFEVDTSRPVICKFPNAWDKNTTPCP